MSCGQYNSAVIFSKKKQSGSLMTWGPNYNGQLGYHFNELGPSLAPTNLDVLKGVEFAEVAFGYNHILALAADGTVHVWGGNAHGQLGTGDSKDRNKPTVVRCQHSIVCAMSSVGAHGRRC